MSEYYDDEYYDDDVLDDDRSGWSDVYSDGMVLDEVVRLIDEGKCNV